MAARDSDDGGSSRSANPVPNCGGTESSKRPTTARFSDRLKRRAAKVREEDKVLQVQIQSPPASGHIQLFPTSESALCDSDLLDCPICVSPLSSPVFQCDNGHVACQQCCIQMSRKCPSCSCATGRIRCRWAEKFLESLMFSCQYAEHGCEMKMTYPNKRNHEDMCSYAPCSCPHDDCSYTGMSERLFTHFSESHQDSSKLIYLDTPIFVSLDNFGYVFLLEKGQSTLFVLKHCAIKSFGNFVNVTCIAPASSKNKFSYELSATDGENTISFRGNMEPTPKLTRQSPFGKHLIVPRYFVDPNANALIRLKLIIRKGS